MTDNTIELSRRKILGGIGAVGVASAGAALGTSAYFSDQESFEGNSLTAGELLLHGSWQQIYYGPEGNTDNYDPYGDAGHPWVNAHPDDTENGIQSRGNRRYVEDPNDDPAMGRNIPLNCADFEELGGAPAPVIELDDVKPGDEGEVTFGFTLCDNPGYVWMTGGITSESPGAGEGQLADYLYGKVWRDGDCDNVKDGLEESDIVLMVDFSGSMLYSQYDGVVSDDEITVGDSEYGETDYSNTALIDLVEKGVLDFIDRLQNEIDSDPDINAEDIRLGAVFFDGYSDDGDENDPGPNVVTSADLPTGWGDWGDDDDDGFTSDITDLVTLVDGDAPMRNLREKLDDLFDGTGTALEEAFEEQTDLFDERVDKSRTPQSITFTDGEPYFGGSLDNDRFVDLISAANDARVHPDYATNIFVVGEASDDDRAQFTQEVIAGPAGSPLATGDLNAAFFAGYDDEDPIAYGGDPSFYFDLEDSPGLPALFDKVALEILPEDVLTCGPLSSVLQNLSSGELLDAMPHEDGTNCFEPELTHCAGFSWEFPIRSTDPEAQMDNNDVQGASMAFDLGLYAEQCRHNEDPPTSPLAD